MLVCVFEGAELVEINSSPYRQQVLQGTGTVRFIFPCIPSIHGSRH